MRLKMLAWDEHSSLLRKSVNYGRNKAIFRKLQIRNILKYRPLGLFRETRQSDIYLELFNDQPGVVKLLQLVIYPFAR